MKGDDQDRDFIDKYRNIDFSSESVNKEKNLEMIKSRLKNNECEREIFMNRKAKKPITLLVVAASLICLSLAVYGQDLFRIVKTVTLGRHAEYYVTEDNREFIPIPEELIGQVFDKAGNELKVFPDDRILYNKNGQEVMPIFDNGKARLMTEDEFEASQPKIDSNRFTVNDPDQGKSYFICDTLSPSYLPDGYVFDRIEFYSDPSDRKNIENGVDKYMDVYYSKGGYEMRSHVRYMDEETAFGSIVTENMQKVSINGYDAVIDTNTLNIQIENVMYMFFANEDINVDELVKIAESLR